MMFRTSTPNHPLAPTGHSERQVRNGNSVKTGVRGFYIIMQAGWKGLTLVGLDSVGLDSPNIRGSRCHVYHGLGRT